MKIRNWQKEEARRRFLEDKRDKEEVDDLFSIKSNVEASDKLLERLLRYHRDKVKTR